MSEKPTDAGTLTAQRLAKVLVWKTGFRRGVEMAVQNDWYAFKSRPDYKAVVDRFAEEFAKRLTAWMFSKVEGADEFPSFRELANVYRTTFWPGAKSPDEVMQGCWEDFDKLLERSLASRDSNVIPRLTILMQDWVGADAAKADALEEVFANCVAMALQGGNSGAQSNPVVPSNAEGLKEEVRARNDDSARGTKEEPTQGTALATVVKPTPTSLTRMSSEEWREEVKAVSKPTEAAGAGECGGNEARHASG